MNIAICQLPDGMALDSLAWDRFTRRVERARPDVTVLNELPFGPWTATPTGLSTATYASAPGGVGSSLTPGTSGPTGSR